ncbi:unnamed protein product [Somion occarium]|uniref:Uncharacterized protein n=1 Tax=Somion occarium TaxID=3059160 RepID=A0ABP1D1R6_9APHY
MTRHVPRMIVLGSSFIGAFVNTALAIRLLALWRSLRWESESEWEGSADAWRVDPVKLVWGLLSAYFALAAAASAVGFFGIARRIPSFVRLFRDFSIADFAFTTVSTIAVGYSAFTSPYVRSGVCEELSRQPDLLRDIAETGLSLENCEFWFERAIVVVLGISVVLIAIRLHFVIALAKYYNQVRRDRIPKLYTSLRPIKADSLQRIYLLPTPTSPSSSLPSNFNTPHQHNRSRSEVLIYAPVPLGDLSEQDARELNATEAWISTPSTPNSPHSRTHRHTHSHPHPHAHSHTHPHRSHKSTFGRYRDDELSPLSDEKLIDTSA